MTKRQLIQQQLTEAMKSKDVLVLGVLRVLWAQVRNAEIEKKSELDDSEIIAAIARQIKQLSDALVDFTAASRADLVDKTAKELSILQVYMPEQISDDVISNLVQEVLAEMPVAAQSNFGAVMGKVMQKVDGRADGVRVRDIVQRCLSARA